MQIYMEVCGLRLAKEFLEGVRAGEETVVMASSLADTKTL